MSAGHRPVLLREVVSLLAPGEGRTFVDGTFGRGGHTGALLEAGARVIGVDCDPEAVAVGREWESRWGRERFRMVRSRFGRMADVVGEWGLVDGVLLDLGVSSPQLDCGERGFSLMRDGPLDMRMDPAEVLTAEMIVNEQSEEALKRMFWEYGEERASGRIAREIVRARERRPIRTTLELAALVEQAVGGRRGSRTHPATRVFQALRMVVNGELEELDRALESAPGMLRAGGRLAVISFHSLEDRKVKRFIAERSCGEIRGEGMAFGVANPRYCLKKLGDWAATEEEKAENPRARSARLRGAERI